MPDSGNHDFPPLVVDVIYNPIISDPNSVCRVTQLFGIRAARFFADLVKFIDDPLTKHFLHAAQLLICAGSNQNVVTLHYVLNVHEGHYVINAIGTTISTIIG